MISGSAPIKPEVFEFMKAIMCCEFYEGYGQTENTGAAFISYADDPVVGHVGAIVVNYSSILDFYGVQASRYSWNALYKQRQGRSGQVNSKGRDLAKRAFSFQRLLQRQGKNGRNHHPWRMA